jgi:thioredoxin 1
MPSVLCKIIKVCSNNICGSLKHQSEEACIMKEVDNEDDLIRIFKTADNILVLFYASWCPFCRMFLPIFEEHAREKRHDEFLRVRIDDEDNPLGEKYEVAVVPTVILFKAGKVQRRLDGILGAGLTEDQLRNFLI